MVYKEWLDVWLDTFVRTHVKPSTFRSYKQDSGYLTPLFDLELNELDYFRCQTFVNSLSAYSRSLIGRVTGLLRRSMDCAVRCGKISGHNLNSLEIPKGKPTKRVQALSEFEINQLYKVPAHQRGHYYDFFMFLLFSGMRIGEAIALEHEDIYGEVIHIRRRNYRGEVYEQPKTAAGVRDIPLTAELSALINRAGSRSGTLWRNSRGEEIDYRRALDCWHKLQKRAGFVRSYGLHALRHTFATILYNRGADIKTLSALLGHSKVSVTYDIYCHVTREQLKNAIELMRRHG